MRSGTLLPAHDPQDAATAEAKKLPQLQNARAGSAEERSGEPGQRQEEQTGSSEGAAEAGLASENARLREQLNLMTLRVDILVEMLALANLDVDELERKAKSSK